MPDMTKQRFDVTTSMGISFKDLRFSKLMGLIEDGTLRADDLVVVRGFEHQGQMPLGRLNGVSFPEISGGSGGSGGGGPAAAPSAWGGARKRTESSVPLPMLAGLITLGGAAVIGVAAFAWFVFGPSGDDARAADSIAAEHFQSHKAFLGLQSNLAVQLDRGKLLFRDGLGETEKEIQDNWQAYLSTTSEAETREQLRAMLSDAFIATAVDFQGTYLSASADEALESMSYRNGISEREALLDWLIAETLMDFGLAHEIWQHEGQISNDGMVGMDGLDKAFIRRVALLGEETRPKLKDGAKHLRENERSSTFRVFGGSFQVDLQIDPERENTLPDMTLKNSKEPVPVILEGDLILLKNLAYGNEPDLSRPNDQVEVDFVHEDGRWRGFWVDQIRAYAERLEETPWAQDDFAYDQISNTDLVVDQFFQTASGDLDQDAWVENFGRSIPMISEGGGNGTGFLIEENDRLYLVTNRHVIDGASAPLEYRPAMKTIRVWHMTVDGLSKISEKHGYYLEPSDFKVHADGIDLAVADVTSRRGEYKSHSIHPLPMTPEIPGRGDELFWVGHPGALVDTDASEASPDDDVFWERNNDLLKFTEGNLNLSKEYSGRKTEHWKQGVTNILFVDTPIVAGNSGGPMFSSQSQQIVGVCTMGILSGEGSKHGAIRSEHVYETIASGVRWDPDSMGPNEPVISPAVLSRYNVGSDFVDSNGVRTGPDGAQWDLVFHDGYEPLSAEKNYQFNREEMKITSGHVKRNDPIMVCAYPQDKSIDLDGYLINSSGGNVDVDEKALDKKVFAEVVAGARGFSEFRVRNASEEGSTPVLIMVFVKR